MTQLPIPNDKNSEKLFRCVASCLPVNLGERRDPPSHLHTCHFLFPTRLQGSLNSFSLEQTATPGSILGTQNIREGRR